jgi:hypothetical protein
VFVPDELLFRLLSTRKPVRLSRRTTTAPRLRPIHSPFAARLRRRWRGVAPVGRQAAGSPWRRLRVVRVARRVRIGHRNSLQGGAAARCPGNPRWLRSPCQVGSEVWSARCNARCASAASGERRPSPQTAATPHADRPRGGLERSQCLP